LKEGVILFLIKKIAMTTPSNLLLVVTATTTALMAGLFYAWSVSVTPGLAHVTDREYVAAMQAMNRAILNPVFFAAFMGTLFLLPVTTYVHYAQPLSARFWFLTAATVVYVVGVFGVTAVGNVPLNNALDVFPLATASDTEVAARRLSFEGPWNSLNTIRTYAAVLAIVLVILACLSPKESVASV
jgi:uncharacterized membrane protein